MRREAMYSAGNFDDILLKYPDLLVAVINQTRLGVEPAAHIRNALLRNISGMVRSVFRG